MIILIMGVAGSGKTTLGKALAQSLNCPFHDADDFHSSDAREKMRQGIGLSDEDRQPWLEELVHQMKEWETQNPQTVLACSALKQKYRECLETAGTISWVYLKGDKALIQKRLKSRQGHFVTDSLLDSQFAALEEPDNALVLEAPSDLQTLLKTLIIRFKAQ